MSCGPAAEMRFRLFPLHAGPRPPRSARAPGSRAGPQPGPGLGRQSPAAAGAGLRRLLCMGQVVGRMGRHAPGSARAGASAPPGPQQVLPGRELSLSGNRFTINSQWDSPALAFPACSRVELAGDGGWRGFSTRGGLIRWCKMDLADQSRFQSWEGRGRTQGLRGAGEAAVCVRRGTDEQTGDIVKAYDPRLDLLLLEGEENNMQN